ncbi:MAG: methyltransferase domain-containing protein [Methylococcaceae bacterium]|nr:MAG: methyltransferase domain-containing protein [Methylococcaceae bacterium]
MHDLNLKAIAAMYDSPEVQLIPEMFGGYVHWGYWDESNADADFAGGSDKLAQLMIDRVRIQPNQRFCDLGCGLGVSAIKLSKTRKCYVDGVTISKLQQQSATQKAKAEGLEGWVKFMHADALHLPCADQTYDGGWFFESIFHMGHRAALAEASRILKPGATLLLTDMTLLSPMAQEFKRFAESAIHSDFVSKEDYPSLLEDAGFELVELWDITSHVMAPLVPKFKKALAMHKQSLKNSITEKTVEDWIYALEYMSKNLGYILVTARKR